MLKTEGVELVAPKYKDSERSNCRPEVVEKRGGVGSGTLRKGGMMRGEGTLPSLTWEDKLRKNRKHKKQVKGKGNCWGGAG